ncbi:hypothetical protein ACF0H5_022500 [Mactra antiquata]
MTRLTKSYYGHFIECTRVGRAIQSINLMKLSNDDNDNDIDDDDDNNDDVGDDNNDNDEDDGDNNGDDDDDSVGDDNNDYNDNDGDNNDDDDDDGVGDDNNDYNDNDGDNNDDDNGVGGFDDNDDKYDGGYYGINDDDDDDNCGDNVDGYDDESCGDYGINVNDQNGDDIDDNNDDDGYDLDDDDDCDDDGDDDSDGVPLEVRTFEDTEQKRTDGSIIMKHVTGVISTIILVNCCHVITCLSPEIFLDDDVISDVNSKIQNEHISKLVENGLEITENNKRAPLSLNGELRSLADMVNQARRQGERSAQHSALLQLGKRSLRLPVFDFSKSNLKSSASEQYPQISTVTRRRSQQLSVSGPLSALADMLAVEGRRRKEQESMHNRMMLLQTGKRSDDHVTFDDVNLQADETFNSEYL